MRRRAPMVPVGWAIVACVGILGGSVAPATASVTTPDHGVTVGSARNQATGDVLGLGYEQVVRIEGSAVVVAEPTDAGGDVLRRFHAEADVRWPRMGSQRNARPLFYGGMELALLVRHDASRIAVLGEHIYVSRLLSVSGWPDRAAGSIVSKYTADGTLVTWREFPDDIAVTALDAYQYGERDYLAIGLNTRGVRVARADESGLPDFRAVHEDWTGRGTLGDARDQVTVVALGADDAGRFMLVAGKLTYGHPAIVVSDLRPEAGDDPSAAQFRWKNNDRGELDPWQWPDLVDIGRLGSAGRSLVAISWPSIGRVSFLDTETGADWTWVDWPTGAHALRFFTGGDGVGYVAIARDARGGVESYLIATADERDQWVTVEEGAKDDLPAALTERTGR